MQATDSSYERGQKDNWLSSSKSIMDFLLSVVDKYIFNSEWTKSKLKSHSFCSDKQLYLCGRSPRSIAFGLVIF